MSNTNSLFLTSIAPSCDGLLAALRTALTDKLILEMAESDVLIPEEVAANKSVLTTIRDSGVVPGSLPWNPGEICNLLRWDVQADRSVSTMKLFGCWILIRAYTQIESMESGLVDDGDEHAIIALVEAALDLGHDYPEQTAGFLYWVYLTLLDGGEHRSNARPFYLFGLLILAASVSSLVSNQELTAIAQELHEEERRVRDSMANDSYASGGGDFPLWLLGLAGDDLNKFRSRCYNLARRACSALRNERDEGRRRLLDDILSRWNAIQPTTVG
jgi:hypothetical protein